MADGAENKEPKVVGLDNKPVDWANQDLQSKEAARALRALLAQIEAGEVKPVKWILLFEEESLADPSLVEFQSLNSDLTLEQAVFFLQRCQHQLLMQAMRPT